DTPQEIPAPVRRKGPGRRGGQPPRRPGPFSFPPVRDAHARHRGWSGRPSEKTKSLRDRTRTATVERPRFTPGRAVMKSRVIGFVLCGCLFAALTAEGGGKKDTAKKSDGAGTVEVYKNDKGK